MAKTLNLRVNEKDLARMLKVKEMDIAHAEKNGRLFNGIELPEKNVKGYKIGEVLAFLEKVQASK
ncbi:TPA: hypothetical protein ACI69G_000829 [Escherichia coli]|uniref:hypothetical protein n=1 Tax=Escherichia coli TaxID=562 RepID=UPI000941EDBA|nr:hypothetical protein [Escherichia coli]MDF4161951.1 hypothetical protein [Escherichia coli]MJP27042.1 hypothetical protein [Escherichia coli]OKU57936.1 hypothetical protein ACN85_21715 [Escherichia coli]OKU68024.1 hypothetical protein ACN85_01120 [Escherichia coli]HBB9085420.1 hypothetical protein [Escherichia coli]